VQNLTENGEKFTYEAGHAIDVICPNDDNELEKLFQALGVDKQRQNHQIKLKIEVPNKKTAANLVQLTNDKPISVYYLFKYLLDIRNNSLKKSLLRTLADYCGNEKEKRRLLELCSKEGSQEYHELIKVNSFSLLDLLNTFKSCKPPLDHLIQLLSAHTSRAYSLSSCPSDTEMEFLFNLVEFDRTQSRTYERTGVATGYLSSLISGQSFYFLRRKMQNFVLPNDFLKTPLIMIGPGTGVAPFIGFLRERARQIRDEDISVDNIAEWSLYYGCRDPNKDFLFKEELLDNFTRDKNVLAHFSISFSRFTGYFSSQFREENSKYVQDAIKMRRKEIVECITQKNGYVYVCGDAQNMSKDVFSCLASCIESELAGDENNAIKDPSRYLIDMMAAKRYRQDIWS